jgi:aspartyl protease family protein
MIFLGVVAGYGLWGDVRDDIMPRQAVIGSGVIEVPLANDGHYHLVLELNGIPVDFLVDTGASEVVLTKEDAARIGLDPDSLSFHESAMTANGVVRSAPATVRTVTLGDIRDEGLRIAVNGGDMDGSLLGMSYLDRFDRIEISDGKLVLTR